nr:hypothetical protein Itr_chr14CG11260 [Ipomoea trifida]
MGFDEAAKDCSGGGGRLTMYNNGVLPTWAVFGGLRWQALANRVEGEIKDDIINFHCGSIPESISVRSPIGGGGVSFWVKKAPTAWILPGRHKIVRRRSVPIGIWARIPGLFFHLFYLLLFPSFYQHCCVNFGLRA